MPFDSLKFRYSWRPYQQRVLDSIDQHLDDDRLHVVAAPGAGKTTLGLEVFRRLRKCTLVLSPTRVIRDQWISVAERWRKALTVDDSARVLPSVVASALPGLRSYHFKNTLKHLLFQLSAALAGAAFLALATGGKNLKGVSFCVSYRVDLYAQR